MEIPHIIILSCKFPCKAVAMMMKAAAQVNIMVVSVQVEMVVANVEIEMMVVVGATAEPMLPDALKRAQTSPKHSPTLSDTQKRSWEAPRTLPNALRRSKMLRDAPSTYQMLARRFQTFPAPSRSAPNAPKCLRRHQPCNTTRTTNKSATVCTTRKQQQNDRRQALAVFTAKILSANFVKFFVVDFFDFL